MDKKDAPAQDKASRKRGAVKQELVPVPALGVIGTLPRPDTGRIPRRRSALWVTKTDELIGIGQFAPLVAVAIIAFLPNSQN